MAQLRLGYPEIARSGAEVLQITHNTAEEAQRYFKHYPIAFPYLCDPGRVVHEAYGLTLQTASVKNVTASAMTTVSDLLRRGEKTPAAPSVRDALRLQGLAAGRRHRRSRWHRATRGPGGAERRAALERGDPAKTRRDPVARQRLSWPIGATACSAGSGSRAVPSLAAW
jgi:AhpC/TSA family